ncbi:MAG: hybrid sensor histidine kinase/response regulator [Sandaracinus sp.]
MAAQQFRESALAELGVRCVALRAGATAAAARELATDLPTLTRVIEEARREGAAVDRAAGLAARLEGESVVVHSTAALRTESLAWAGVAHELRNALTTIAGWATIAADSKDAARQRRAIAMVQESARDAMDVAPLLLEDASSAGSTEVARAVRQAVDRLLPVAASRKVELTCRRIDEANVRMSRAALGSIVVNLVKNAIEACETGGHVEVGVRDADRKIEILVEDDGRGMTDEKLARLFRASQAEREGARAGRGIGLSVVRELVGRAGGAVRATSRLGSGSCVRVELPKAEAAAGSSGVRARSASRRVLVVDDHASLADLVASALTARGAEVVVTAKPAEAIAAAEEERFDVALVDLDLGEASGAPLVKQLVARHLARRVVVMSGASAVPDLGADGLLRKPFDLRDVEEVALESTRVGRKRRAQ